MRYDNSKVRRQDRLLSEEAAMKLLSRGEYGVLSVAGDHEGGAYGIPVNYVWDGAAALYIHCAPEGRKLRIIGTDPKVSFCVVGHTKVLSSGFTTEYESLILDCTAHTGLSGDEKRKALGLFVEKYSPDYAETGSVYIERSLHRTEIIRLGINVFSGKAKLLMH